MRHFLLGFLSIFFAITTSLSQTVKSPDEFLGYELGSTFTPHHRVVDYYHHVASQLGNVKLEAYGRTNEGRLLQIAYVSSQANINRLEEIRLNNLKHTGIVAGVGNTNTAIVWLSYNVHGNEASSTEASMKTIYELVTQKQAWLENTLVIIDPCINPDGRDRYVNWFKQVRAMPYNKAQLAKEHNEPWPGGRPNHYLFDLNRDWAWATQVESQQRLKVYNKWLPHVHVDFHEQGINEPYYFAPAAEPFHEVISNWQRNFQTQIGKNHAKYFDKEGWLYFTGERFDLFYPSYGDTYPTYMGAIGMTYEQAGHGRAGLGVMNDEGIELTLKDRLQHHTTTGLSTVEISSKNAQQLNQEFKKYFDNSSLKYKSYVLRGDSDKLATVKALLDRHEITYGKANNANVKGFDYNRNAQGSMRVTANDLVVSTDQPKGKMVKVLFEPDAKLSDSLTYDITAWSLPYAHGLLAMASTKLIASTPINKLAKTLNNIDKQAYAYVAKWDNVKDAEFMGQLLQKGIKVRFTEVAFSTQGNFYKPGTLIIVRGDNQKHEDFDTVVASIADALDREIIAVKSGFVDTGSDFGSPNVKLINNQRVGLLSGDGTSSLSFGAIWHFFETQLHYPVTVLDTKYFGKVDLDEFDVLVLPEGSYSSTLNESTLKKVKEWVKNGGKVIAIGSAVKTFADKDGFALKTNKGEEKDKEKSKSKPNLTPYEQREREHTKEMITGSIYQATVDNSHPMAFGYPNYYYTLKLGNSSYKQLEKGFNVVYLTDAPKPVSGFAGSEAQKKQGHTLIFGEERMGSGSIIYMVDNPLFRAFWENGKLFFTNAIFMTNNNKFRI